MKVSGMLERPGKLLSKATEVEPRKLLSKATDLEPRKLLSKATDLEPQKLLRKVVHRDTHVDVQRLLRVARKADGQQLLDTGLQVLEALTRVSEPGPAKKAAGSGRLRTVAIATGATAGLIAASARISEHRRRSELPSDARLSGGSEPA